MPGTQLAQGWDTVSKPHRTGAGQRETWGRRGLKERERGEEGDDRVEGGHALLWAQQSGSRLSASERLTGQMDGRSVCERQGKISFKLKAATYFIHAFNAVCLSNMELYGD